MHTSKINNRNIIWAVLLIGIYFVMFWCIERREFLLYFTLISSAFLFHLYPLSNWGYHRKPAIFIVTGLLIKLMAVSAMPSLSEDIYRYIWDGYLTNVGVSPFAYSPDECIRMFSQNEHPVLHSLYPMLNSASYYSVYPPLAQLFFSFGGWLTESWGIAMAVTGLKSIFLMVELLGWFFMYQLFQIQKIELRWLYALWLNPLLILEWNFSGHIESLATTFLIISVYMIITKENRLSAVLLALAVLVKLWPMLFAPFFLKFIKTRTEQFKWITAFVLTGAIGSLSLVIQPEYFSHFMSSLILYFRTFEFNASVYYLLRAIGIWVYGYNPIHFIGPLCTILMLGLCIWLYLKIKLLETRYLMDSIVICGIVYLLLATTIHPWYLSLLLPFAYLARRWSIVLWSYLIFISYQAYSYIPVKENFTILICTYSIVFMALFLDMKGNKKVNIE